MADTALLGGTDSQPGNIILGLGAAIPAFATTTPATHMVEVVFNADPVTSSGYYYNDLNDAPIAYWRMDNQTSLIDQTGAGNNMTVDGAPTLVTGLLSGDSNQATSFDGTNDDAFALNSLALTPTGPLSLELWIKTPSSFAGSTVDVASKRGSYRLQLTTGGKLIFSVKNQLLAPSVTSVTALAVSSTYHVACVYDGTRILIYLNGVLDVSTGYSGGIEQAVSPLVIARTDAGSASPTFRSVGFSSDGYPTGGVTAGKPAGTADGDYLVAFVMSQVALTVTPPAGWTLLGQTPSTGTPYARIWAYGKIASGEPANYTWALSESATFISVETVAYTGVSAVVPHGSFASPAAVTATTIASSILPAYDNTRIVGVCANYGFNGTWTESAGTERLDYQAPGADMALYDIAVASSALTSITGTFSTAGTQLYAAQVELVGTLSSTFTQITVDEVSLFGFALTADQVANHYEQAVNPPPTPTWTDISSSVKNIQIRRGRQYELNRMEAGTASITLNDDLRKFDPANTTGTYAPNVIPMRQIRVSAVLNSVTYPLFRGYVERWESRWETDWIGTHAETNITAVDGFEPLSLSDGTGSVPAALSGTSIANLLGKANWASADRDLDVGAFTLAAITLGSSTILEVVQQVADSEAGIFFINGSGVAVFHDKNHRSTDPLSTVSQGTFGDQTLLALPYTALQPSMDKDLIVNDWTVTDSDGGEHQAESIPSQNRYFHRISSRSTFLSSADAATMATYLLSVTAEPGFRFDVMELCPNRNLPLWTQALTREISDRVTVQRQPVGVAPGSQIVKDCWIEKISWNITPDGPWRVQWQLSPAS